jgi:hypothetical protein
LLELPSYGEEIDTMPILSLRIHVTDAQLLELDAMRKTSSPGQKRSEFLLDCLHTGVNEVADQLRADKAFLSAMQEVGVKLDLPTLHQVRSSAAQKQKPRKRA